MNKAARLAAERHEILNDPNIPDSLAFSLAKPKGRQLQQLSRRLRTGNGSSAPSKDEEDDMVNAPLENALKPIIKSTKTNNNKRGNYPLRHRQEHPPVQSRVPTPTSRTPRRPTTSSSKGTFTKSLKKGALRGLRKHLGVPDTYASDEDKSKPKPGSLKEIEPQPGWEDWYDGKKTRRDLMQEGAYSQSQERGKKRKKTQMQQPRRRS